MGSASLLPASPAPPVLPFCIHHRQVPEAFPAGSAPALTGLSWTLLRRLRQDGDVWITNGCGSAGHGSSPLCHRLPALLCLWLGMNSRHSWLSLSPLWGQTRAEGFLWDFLPGARFWCPLDEDWAWLCLGITLGAWSFRMGSFPELFLLQATSAHPAAAFRGKIQASPKALEGGFTPKCVWGGNESEVAGQRFPDVGEIHGAAGQGDECSRNFSLLPFPL